MLQNAGFGTIPCGGGGVANREPGSYIFNYFNNDYLFLFFNLIIFFRYYFIIIISFFYIYKYIFLF